MATLPLIDLHHATDATGNEQTRLESLGRLAGIVAHDFTNLLTVISARASDLAQHQESQVRRQAEAVLDAVCRAGQLSHQLLSYARSEPIPLGPINLTEVVHQMHGLLRALVGQDVRLDVAASRGVGLVRAERTRLEQIVMNLVLNGRDAVLAKGAPGSVRVEVDEATGPTGAPEVRLRVTDDGCGIPEETLPTIFDLFVTTKGVGHGLGLASVRDAADALGGRVGIVTRQGEGTTFEVRFPRCAVEPGAWAGHGAATAPEDGAPIAPLSVLVADDQPEVRSLVADFLRSLGHRVLEAQDGQDAIRLADAEAGTIDVAVCDLAMPRANGLTVWEHLRRTRPDTVMLLLSGYLDAGSIESGAPPGLAVLRKPFTLRQLAASLGFVRRMKTTPAA